MYRSKSLSSSSSQSPAVIQERIKNKSKELEELQAESSSLIRELEWVWEVRCLLVWVTDIYRHQTSVDPEEIVKAHILGLKKYNELKDVAMGLITMIADQRQLRMADILKEMNIEPDEKK